MTHAFYSQTICNQSLITSIWPINSQFYKNQNKNQEKPLLYHHQNKVESKTLTTMNPIIPNNVVVNQPKKIYK